MADQHNSDYVDAGAAAVANPERTLEGKRIEGLDDVWLGELAGFYLNGDYEGTLYLDHAACGWQTELNRGGIPVTHTHPKGYDYGTFLANVVEAALEHECPK